MYRLILARFPGSPAAVRARGALAVLATRDVSDGSTELQVWGTLYGAWLGVLVPLAFGTDDPEPYGVGLLLGGPTGFFVTRAVAERTGLTIGRARAITWGSTWGTWQGFGWREVFDWGGTGRSDCVPGVPCDYGDSEEAAFVAMLVGGAAGIATGALLGRGSLSDAQATAANVGSLWGTWFGFATGLLAGWENDDLLAATLVGGNAGLVGAGLAAPSLGLSRNRWRLVSIGGLLGGLAGLGFNLVAQVEDDKVLAGIPLATSIAGLLVGAAAGRNVDAGAGADQGPAGEPGLRPALLEFDLARDGFDRLGLGAPMPAFRRLPVERDGDVRWRTTVGVTLLRVGF